MLATSSESERLSPLHAGSSGGDGDGGGNGGGGAGQAEGSFTPEIHGDCGQSSGTGHAGVQSLRQQILCGWPPPALWLANVHSLHLGSRSHRAWHSRGSEKFTGTSGAQPPPARLWLGKLAPGIQRLMMCDSRELLPLLLLCAGEEEEADRTLASSSRSITAQRSNNVITIAASTRLEHGHP